MKSFLGTGWGFPVELDARGAKLLHGDELIAQSIWLILCTRPGERLMRPDFGCRIHELLFAPLNATTAGLAREYVRVALRRWEPRITQVEVSVAPDQRRGMLEARIDYRVIATNTRRNLVYPFYLEATGQA